MSGKKAFILIVDDNLRNLQYLGSLLTENGYELGVAQDGPKALEFVKNRKPDLILLDIMMPGMDGYQVCEELKENRYTSFIPVIFLSAKNETNDIVKGFESGAVDYVTKPFNSVELLARVKTHVDMKILRGLLPICSSCKSIRNDEGIWSKLEAYIIEHSESILTHSVCPKCEKELYGKEEWHKGCDE